MMARRSVALSVFLALALSACGSESSELFPEEDGTGSGMPVNADGTQPRTSNSIETADGTTVSQESGSNLPVELPDGFSLYPGASVRANTRTSSGIGDQTTVMFESEAAPDTIVAFYKDQAEKAGLEISIDLAFEDNSTLGGDRASDGLKLTVSASRKEGANVSTVMVNTIVGTAAR